MFRSSSLSSAVAVAVMFGSLCVGLLGRARAEQFTMFDITLEVSQQNTSDAHYGVKPSAQRPFTQPDNWTAPIDYTKGMVYIEHESITKPSNEETQIDICFMTGKGYGCRNTVKYTTTGRYQTVRVVATGFNQFNQIDWTKKIPEIQFVTKDGANVNGGKDKTKFLPHKTRIAMSFVSAGGTYTLPPGWTPAPSADGGTAPGNDAGTGAADASGPGAAGGATGEGSMSSRDAATGAGGSAGNAASGGSSGSGGGSGSGGSSGTSGGASGGGGAAPSGSGGSSGSGSGGSSAGGNQGPGTEPAKPAPAAATPPVATGPCTMAVGQSAPRLPAVVLGFGIAAGVARLRRRRRS